MKKLSKLVVLLTAMIMACAFVGCANSSSGDDNGTTVSFDDCTSTATEVTFADGNWTIKYVMTSDGMNGEANIKATASGGTYNFTSGSATQTVDLSKMMDEDELSEFNALSEADKKNAIISEMNAPADAVFTFNGNVVTIKANMSTADLAKMKKGLNLAELPNDAVIKTNSDNTKYTINFSSYGTTYALYISKD